MLIGLPVRSRAKTQAEADRKAYNHFREMFSHATHDHLCVGWERDSTNLEWIGLFYGYAITWAESLNIPDRIKEVEWETLDEI